MKQTLAEIESNQPIMEGMNLMWLRTPDVARAAAPGQFLMARCSDGFEPLLRRPLSVHRIRLGHRGTPAGIAILYSIHGPGTAYLQTRVPGDALDLIGPLGRGYSVHRASRNLLLIGSGWGVSPLVGLAELQTAYGASVTLLAGAPRAALLFPPALLPPEVELVTATDDGSAGHQGPITDRAPEYWAWADEIYACGGSALYSALAGHAAAQWPKKRVQVLAEMPMACGLGACYSCTIDTRRGPKLSCKDGPRIYLDELLL